jgi:alpha-D-ribose 1-methylphosphonate 5-triphosphate synthase subunit PhnI
MNKAIVVSLERAEEALSLAEKLTEVSSRQLELCRDVAQKVEMAGEIELGSLRKLVGFQTEVRKIRKLLSAVGEPIDK